MRWVFASPTHHKSVILKRSASQIYRVTSACDAESKDPEGAWEGRRVCFCCLSSVTADPSASPGFPVEVGGVGELHAPFLTERRTRGPVLCRVAGNPGSLGMTKGIVAVSLCIACWMNHTKWERSALLCHPERSRGICSYTRPATEAKWGRLSMWGAGVSRRAIATPSRSA
jgi:hypothetical protein